MAKSKSDTLEGKTSKRKMVESAFNALGDQLPGDFQRYIKDKFNSEMGIPMISTYKSQLKKSRGLSKVRKTTKTRIVSEPAGNTRVGIKDVIAVKRMIDSMGAKQLHSIIDAVGGL